MPGCCFGRPSADRPHSLATQVDAVAALPSFYAEDTPASAQEVWQRLHADPLFAIKQQVRAVPLPAAAPCCLSLALRCSLSLLIPPASLAMALQYW